MPITGEDCLKAGEVVKFLEKIGFHNLADEFDNQWNAQIERQAMDEERRCSNSEDETVQRQKYESERPSFSVISRTHLIVSCVGDSSDIYSHREKNLAPSFPYGAGCSVDDFKVHFNDKVELVSCHFSTGQAPPEIYPIQQVALPVFMETGKTGLKPQNEFPVHVGNVIAGQYVVELLLDSGAFSRVVSCVSVKSKESVCLKIVNNAKDSFDQSLDEIKLLLLVLQKGNPDEHCIVRLHDFFYFQEHLFLVTERLKDNLYRFREHVRQKETKTFFTLARIQAIAKQILIALRFLHAQNLMHCDLKPENVAFKSYRECTVKVIDFGSCSYQTDNLHLYIQSRPYRAPEVILGCKYDSKIDIWSLGAMLPELITGKILFTHESLSALLASITAVCGPLPSSMLHEGRNTSLLVSKHGAFYNKVKGELFFYFPNAQVDHSVIFGFDAPEYVNFIEKCLTVDPCARPTAEALLRHPFFEKDYGSCFCSWEKD